MLFRGAGSLLQGGLILQPCRRVLWGKAEVGGNLETDGVCFPAFAILLTDSLNFTRGSAARAMGVPEPPRDFDR